MPEGLNRAWRDEPPPKPDGWRVQEAKAAKVQPGGRLQRGSGSGKGATRKGDATGDLLLVSSKTTEDKDQKGLRVERSWLEEIEQQADNAGLCPALLLGFDGGRRLGSDRVDWLGFPEPMARQLVALWAAVLQGDLGEAAELAQLMKPRGG